MAEGTKPRLAQRYEEEIRGQLKERFGLPSVMAVPKLEKVVVNVGLGAAVQNPKMIDQVVDDIARICAQRPVVTRARKAIANFKLRAGMPIGVAVTLRRERMYEFVDRLINVALPRVRDFRGLSPKAFDGHGNYTVGVREQTIFPEVDLDKVEHVVGLSVAVVTTAEDDEKARALLQEFGFPFRS